MISDKLLPPIWIATPIDLQSMADRLSRENRLAIDTESNSLHAFREQVCLVQFSIPDIDYLVDPLAIPDFSPLSELLSNPNIEKTFHAAEYDLLCLKRDFNFNVVNMFDTMQAARILGYPAVGLNNLLNEKFNINLDKRFQKADWAKRPLPSDQLNYARMDTHYLLDLRDLLDAELKKKDLSALAQEEFERISYGNGQSEQEASTWQRMNGATRLSPSELAVLKELLDWRFIQAKRMNRPVFKIINDKLLISIAETKPNRMDDLQAIGMTSRQSYIFGNDILSAVRKGLKAPPIKRTSTIRPDQAYMNRLEILRIWRKNTAQKLGVESDVVLPRSFMQSIAEGNPQDLQSLSELMPHSPWRLNQYGQEILGCLKGK
jgi:ribonuclease D